MATECALTYVPLSILIEMASREMFDSKILGASESLSFGNPLYKMSFVSSEIYFFIF